MDGLTIGSLITERALEKTGLLQQPALGTEYNLVYMLALNAQDVGVINDGLTDTSKVYKLIAPAYDMFSNSIITMDVEHAKIHAGYHFFQGGVFTLGANATMNIVVETTSVRPHMTFRVDGTEAGFTLTTREGIAANADGTLLPVLNNNRTHTNGNQTTLRLNPTGIVTAGSIVLRDLRSGSGSSGVNTRTGNADRANEVIMKPNTKYLLTITNLGNATNYINVVHEWYEA